MTGNAAINPLTNYLGTNDNQPLIVRTNNVERLRVLGTGNVGIGTATADARLTIQPGADGRIMGFLLPNGNPNWEIFSVTDGLTFCQTNVSCDRLVLSTNGNVGIGTAPASKLSVNGGLSVGSTYSTTNAAPTNGAIFQGNVGIGNSSPINVTGETVLQIGSDVSNPSTGSLIFSRRSGSNSSGSFKMGMNSNHQFSIGDFGNQGGNTYTELFTINAGGNGSLPIGRVGIGTNNPSSLLSVNGTADKPGGGSWGTFSDARLKQDVQHYSAGLADVLKIHPVTYHYNTTSGYDTKPEYIGVIAQELQQVAPYMVSTFTKDGTEYLKVDNSGMTYMLVNAVQELSQQNQALQKGQAEIQTLKTQNAELQKRLDALTAQMQVLTAKINSSEAPVVR